MQRWLFGAVVGMCTGTGAYLMICEQCKPSADTVTTSPPAPTAGAPPAPATPATPVVLPRVVEMADLDPLLDPAPRPPSGTPFDPEPAPAPSTTTAPKPIPTADE